MRTFFTADTHFGDHRTLNIHKRPFANVAEMDAEMVHRWNAVVGPDDIVWHLGDFARRAEDVEALLRSLHGTKHLLRGNNDPVDVGAARGWHSVHDYAEIEDTGHALVLGHYAFRTWNGKHRGAVNLHGHSHGRLKPIPRQFDVGADARDFMPVTLPQILARGG